MARIQAVVTTPHEGGLAENATVNTWAFQVATLADPGDYIRECLSEFYSESTGSDGAVCDYFSPAMNWNATTLACTDVDDPTPRVPFYEGSLSLTTSTTAGTALPHEVAVCCSFATDAISGAVAARQRGRVFLGPLKTTAGSAPAGADSRPSPAFIAAVNLASERLCERFELGVFVWSIWSRANDEFYPVTRGWVDNAWDTMRSRGLERTTKNTWGPLVLIP